MTQLHLRGATHADRDALVAFNGDVLRYQDANAPDAGVAAWTRDLLDGRHPHVGPEDFCVVEDTDRRRIVSSLCLVSQTWSYDGIPVSVGQPELVGTHPEYRGQGLVRRQVEVLHQWSAARGQQLLAIDGIPGFYGQFGYGMALALRAELSIESTSAARASDRALPYRVRPAGKADIAFMADTDAHARSRYLMAACRDANEWHHELHGRSPSSQPHVTLAIVESPTGAPAGYLVHASRLLGTFMTLLAYELMPPVWEEATPRVLQHLRSIGESFAAAAGTRCDRIGLCLGDDHPAYATIQHLAPRDEGAYAWQLRVPEVPGFLRHIAPLLERRLAQSDLAAYTGQLGISFYRNGVRLVFARGRLTDATAWQVSRQLTGIEKGVPSSAGRADASFPDHTFLQLLFGYRSLDELQYAFPDCLVRNDTASALLTALFPKRPSNVWPVL